VTCLPTTTAAEPLTWTVLNKLCVSRAAGSSALPRTHALPTSLVTSLALKVRRQPMPGITRSTDRWKGVASLSIAAADLSHRLNLDVPSCTVDTGVWLRTRAGVTALVTAWLPCGAGFVEKGVHTCAVPGKPVRVFHTGDTVGTGWARTF
jgi:hypothetical protein